MVHIARLETVNLPGDFPPPTLDIKRSSVTHRAAQSLITRQVVRVASARAAGRSAPEHLPAFTSACTRGGDAHVGRWPLAAESHFEADIGEPRRALERLNRNHCVEIVTQVERRMITLTPLEPALRAELEGHAECPVEGKYDRLRQIAQHSGREVGGPRDREGAHDRAERYVVEDSQR